MTESELRQATRRWLDNWAAVSPYLEAERIARLQRMDEQASGQIAIELWADSEARPGDGGEGLVAIGRASAALGVRS